jgi:hypothetical protein
MVFRENPAKRLSQAKNPPNYTTAYLVQQSNRAGGTVNVHVYKA